jgi:hypothetical protein
MHPPRLRAIHAPGNTGVQHLFTWRQFYHVDFGDVIRTLLLFFSTGLTAACMR